MFRKPDGRGTVPSGRLTIRYLSVDNHELASNAAQEAPVTVSGLGHGTEVPATAAAVVAGANSDFAKSVLGLVDNIGFVVQAIDKLAKVRVFFGGTFEILTLLLRSTPTRT